MKIDNPVKNGSELEISPIMPAIDPELRNVRDVELYDLLYMCNGKQTSDGQWRRKRTCTLNMYEK